MKVSVKHAGKVYDDFELDPAAAGSVFKQAIYERTGVPPERMKVMIKGGMLKDDVVPDWTKLGVKEVRILLG